MSTYYQTGAGYLPFGSSTGESLELPECSIEDVDVALFNLFNKDLDLYYKENNKNSKRVPVIFATGERFAVLRRKKPLRDKSSALILPLISISRTGVTQTVSRGMGTNQNGDIVIKKKLSPKDPAYQRFLNKENLINQDDRAHPSHYLPNIDRNSSDGDGTEPGKIAKRRPGTKTTTDFDSGRVLTSKAANNIYEVYSIRSPKYFTATYDITIWTQYMQQMNNILSCIMSSYHSQGIRSIRIESEKGYYFVAYFGDSISSETNFDDFSDDERIVKYSMSVEVNGYIINPKFPGSKSTVTKYISAPQISFDMIQVNAMPKKIDMRGITSGNPDDYILQDLTTIDEPLPAGAIGNNSVTNDPPYYKNTNLGGTESGVDPLLVERKYIDPTSGQIVTQELKIKSRNQRSGETVYKEQITYDLGEIVLTPK